MYDFHFSWLPKSNSLVACKYQDSGEGRHGSQGFLHAKSDVFRAKLHVTKRRGGKRCCLSSAAKFWVFLYLQIHHMCYFLPTEEGDSSVFWQKAAAPLPVLSPGFSGYRGCCCYGVSHQGPGAPSWCPGAAEDRSKWALVPAEQGKNQAVSGSSALGCPVPCGC